jgi:hypothetical protein
MGALILALLPLGDEARTRVEALARPTLRNWNGIEVGEVGAVASFTAPASA